MSTTIGSNMSDWDAEVKRVAEKNRAAKTWVETLPPRDIVTFASETELPKPPRSRDDLEEAFNPDQPRDHRGRWRKTGINVPGVSWRDGVKRIAETAPVTAEFLGAMREVRGVDEREGYEYVDTTDLILREGRAWDVSDPTGPATPPEYEHLKGELGECFFNAGQAIGMSGMGGYGKELPPGARYVEGYAFTPNGWPPIPVHHAWIVDGSDEVLELTWPEMGTEYVGVEVSPTHLRKLLLKSQMWGVLDNWEQGHPELKGDWKEANRER